MSIHGKDAYFAIEDGAGTTLRNMSPYLNNTEFTRSNDNHDDTTYGQEGHTYRNGLTDGGFTISGLWDKTADVGTYTVLKSLVGTEITVAFEFGPEGNGAGMTKQSGECVLATYVQSAPVADLISFTGQFKISGSVTDGTFSA